MDAHACQPGPLIVIPMLNCCVDMSPEFLEGKQHRPNVIKQVQYAIKRIVTGVGQKPIANEH